MEYHEPVLLKESIDALHINPDGIYIDATYGGGGHSREILKKLKKGKLIAFDQDADAIQNKMEDDHLLLIRDNFSNLRIRLEELQYENVDGILADLGISSHQINQAERGFSTRYNAELDMRMDRRNNLTAKYILNNYKEENLVGIFSQYGEIRNSRQLASAIIKSRQLSPLNTTDELKAAIKSCIPFKKEAQYLAQLFQALRIEVNSEMDALKKMLDDSSQLLKSGGRLAVISYHSLEDRLVKNLINSGNTGGEVIKDIYGNITGLKYRSVTKKPVVPSEAELEANPRSRSAKLRVAERL